MKRAQIAMESIMIYGLAILVVMLAIGALMYFNVLDLGSLLPNKCEIKGVSLRCENYAVTNSATVGADTVLLEIRNNLGKNINLVSIDIEGETGTDMYNMWNCPMKTVNTIISNGDKTPITLTACDIKIPVGKKISGIIDLKYNIIGSTTILTVFGDIKISVQ